MMQGMLVRGRWIVADRGGDSGVLQDAAVRVEDGRIAEIGDWRALRERYPDAAVVGSERHAVLPGLINSHHHSNGVSVLQQGVADQLLEFWIFALGLCRPLDPGLSTLLSAARLLRSGVTSVVEVHSGRGTAEAYEATARGALAAYDAAGIRVSFAAGTTMQSFLVAGKGQDEAFLAGLPKELRSMAAERLPQPGDLDEDDYFGIMEGLWRAYRGHPRIDVWFAPPGPQWVSDEVLLRTAEAAERLDTGIQTHVNESLYEMLHGLRFYGRSTLSHLHELGVLGPRFSIAHGVWLTEPEIDILAETGTTVVHNPSSNLRLRAGIAPLNAFLSRGAPVALGMDGTTINDDEDFFAEMRLALRLHRSPTIDGPAPSPEQIFRLATTGGARLLRKEDRLGAIAPGRAADLVLVDLARVTWPWVSPEADPRTLLLLRAGAADVDTVLVDGEVVLSGGRPTRFDLDEVGREVAAQLAATPASPETAGFLEQLRTHLSAYYRAWELPDLDPYIAYNTRR